MDIRYSECLNWFNRKHSDKINEFIKSVSPKQIKCKRWLADELENIPIAANNIYLIGGWFGYPLIDFIKQQYDVKKLVNIDKDPIATSVCVNFNRIFNYDFVKTVTKSIYDHTESFKDADLIINTSSEHMKDLPILMNNRNFNKSCIFALQSNNMFHIDDHYNCVNSVDELIKKSKLSEILYSGTKTFDNYERYMVIGLF